MDDLIAQSRITSEKVSSKAMTPVLQRCSYRKCGYTFMATAGQTCPNCHRIAVRLNIESELNRKCHYVLECQLVFVYLSVMQRICSTQKEGAARWRAVVKKSEQKPGGCDGGGPFELRARCRNG